MDAEAYDAIIVGTGQSGKPLALSLGEAGWRTVIVERGEVGGTCINVGCTPTKTMIASGRVAYLARRHAEYGVSLADGVAVDLPAVLRRKREVVQQFRDSGVRALEEASNVTLLFGEARFVDAHTIEVALRDGGTRRLRAPKIVLDTGARPAVPPIEGLDRVAHLDSTTIMEVDTLPRHLVVLGGGYIGLEFGQLFRRFGSAVTIVNRDERLVAREDPDVSEAVEGILADDGIVVRNRSQVERVAGAPGSVTVSVRTPSGVDTIGGTHILVALGRTPNTERLDLGAAGVDTDDAGYIRVDPRLETNVPGIYATGDVKGGPAFTHISYDDFRVLRDNWLHGAGRTTEGRLVPNTVYIDPQLATVGVNETQAAKRKLDVRIARLPMSRVARAIETGETRGFMKAVVDARTQCILGCTVLGVDGGELMSMLEIAIMARLPHPRLREAIFAHPTLAESLNNLFATV
jgi:pyruvate/2-oxoglutarate dehydrogenase complex dihydrolipoamide dehydrogenase (E3) component